ncbi:MAG TPA: DegV family protein [Chloroflexota bacterium]|nr:DegV family protein [Chloroflexota bacterium]
MSMNRSPSLPEVAPRGPATRQVAIVCESTCCLPPDLARRYDIGIIPIPFVFGTQTFRDGVDITPAQFYARLAETGTPPKTSPPSPGEYLQAWREASRSASAVLLVTVDGRVSTLQRSARLAQEMAPQALPGVAVSVVDSQSAGMGQGFVALAAARAAMAGQPLAAVTAAAERVRRRVTLLVTLDTLEYLSRASRLPQVATFVGGLLAIKPVVQFSGGHIRLLARPRTRRRAIDELFERVARTVPPGARLHAAVQHAGAEVEAADFEVRLRGAFDCAELYTTEFTPVMGGYCGPGLLGVAFYSEENGDGR